MPKYQPGVFLAANDKLNEELQNIYSSGFRVISVVKEETWIIIAEKEINQE